MNLKGTQTEKNLMTAFSGESMARNKYTFFAEAAKKENHPEVAELFEKMSQNESIHGKLLYQVLYNGIGSSMANLTDAMNGEFKEWTNMYPDFARTAKEEGLPEVAELFEKIAAIERDHEHRFLMALANLTKASAPQTAQKQTEAEPHAAEAASVTMDGYRCMFCGATYEKRPDVCSLCGAIGSFEKTQFQKHIK